MNDIIGDPVLDEMAGELRTALIQRGLDPQDPPNATSPPTERMWEEYQRRGGSVYTDPDLLAEALVKRVGMLDR